MKRLSVFIAACAFAVACKPDPQPTPQPQPDPQPEAKVEFKIVSQNPMDFTAEGGECIIKYAITNPDESLNVSASTDVDWITETDATYAGQDEIVLVVEKNEGEARTATVVVTYDKQYEVVVNQAAAAVEPEPEPQPDPDAVELPYLSAVYYGNMYGATENDYNYSLVLGTMEKVIDLITGEYSIYANSTYLLVDLFSDQPSENYTLSFDVPAGEYVFDPDNTCQAGTFTAEYSYLYVTDEEQGYEIHLTEGKVTVTEEGITAELTAEDGTEYKFHTPVVSVDNTDMFEAEGAMGVFSTLEGDLEIPFEEPSLYAECYDDYFVVGKNSWLMYIDDYATSHSLILEVLAPFEDEVPVGEFKVTTDPTLDHVILPGFVTTSGEAMLSWYVEYGEDGYETVGMAPIVDGTVTITDNGDETYTAVCDLVDDLGNKITGVCTSYFETVGPYYRKAAANDKALQHNRVQRRHASLSLGAFADNQ